MQTDSDKQPAGDTVSGTGPKGLALLTAAQAGDPQALAQLIRLYQPDVRRYAMRHCLLSDVDDAVQEALLVLSRKIAAVRMLSAFSGWLFRIVQRECRKLGRQVLRLDPFEEEKLEQYLARKTTDGLRAELSQALESLPAHYRDIILLRDFEEFSIKEIATALDESPAAVKSRLHRARSLVREYLLGDSALE